MKPFEHALAAFLHARITADFPEARADKAHLYPSSEGDWELNLLACGLSPAQGGALGAAALAEVEGLERFRVSKAQVRFWVKDNLLVKAIAGFEEVELGKHVVPEGEMPRVLQEECNKVHQKTAALCSQPPPALFTQDYLPTEAERHLAMQVWHFSQLKDSTQWTERTVAVLAAFKTLWTTQCIILPRDPTGSAFRWTLLKALDRCLRIRTGV